jgi:Zn-dependent protease
MRAYGRPGGDWQGIRPTIDNPFTWSVPLGRWFGIRVRVHIILLLYIIIKLVESLVPPAKSDPSPVGFGVMAMGLAALFVVVLLHEFGHCLACRWVGGEADEILMWPLGGLAFCQPRHEWRAHLITVLGGPMVNVLICAALTPALGVWTGHWWGTAIPNLLELGAMGGVGALNSWWLVAAYQVNAISFILLWFNLLPIFPLDGGRVVQACLWPRLGYSASMRVALRTGYVGAILLGVFGAVTREWSLLGVAFFGFVTCYLTHKQLEWTDQVMGAAGPEYAMSLPGAKDEEEEAEAKPTRAQRRAARQAQAEREESAETDRILAKIASSGLASLTARERKALKRATARRRNQPPPT